MRIRAYIRLQDCTTSDRKAFVVRQNEEHGIAKGKVRYYAVAGVSWAHIRRQLRNAGVMGWTNCSEHTACAYLDSPDDSIGGLWKLPKNDVPAAARWENVKDRRSAPQLSCFGAVAVEIPRCERCDSTHLTTENNGLVDCDECGHQQKELG